MKTQTTACPRCGHVEGFIGTLAAFTLGLALGVLVMDTERDRRDAQKPAQQCVAETAPLAKNETLLEYYVKVHRGY